MAEHGIRIAGLNAVTRKLQAVNEFLGSTEPMQELCEDIRDLITVKTAAGKDYMNRNFEPYSEEYARRKKKTRPDLRVKGEMMNSIEAKAESPKRGYVDVRGRRQLIAFYHNEGGPKEGKPPKRRFMDISKTGLQKLVKKCFDDPIMKLLGRR